MKIEYPKHMYNSNGEWREVKSEAEKIELGDAWKESPADFLKKSEISEEANFEGFFEDSIDEKLDDFKINENEVKKKRGRPAKVRE
jgi:hypothetical protein